MLGYPRIDINSNTTKYKEKFYRKAQCGINGTSGRNTFGGLVVAFLMILVNVVATIVNYGKTEQSGLAVVSLIASIFAYGIFANYPRDPQNAPTYASWLSMGSGLVGLILLISGLAQ